MKKKQKKENQNKNLLISDRRNFGKRKNLKDGGRLTVGLLEFMFEFPTL